MSKKVFLVIGCLAVVTFFASLLFRSYLGRGGSLSLGSEIMPNDQSYSVPSKMPVPNSASGGMGSAMMAEPDFQRQAIYPSYPYPYIAPSDALGADNRVYLKSANHSVIVNNVSEYVSQLKEYFLSIDGRILNTSISDIDRYQVANMTVKVPVEKFDEATARVTSGVKKVVNEGINSQDITGEIVSQEEELKRLQTDIDEKEADLAELTENSAEWRRVRTQIENLESQLENMTKSVANYKENVMYSTLSVSVANNERYFKGGYGYYGNQPDVAEIFERAWWSAKGNLGSVLSAAVWIAVYSIFWAPIVLLIWWLKRRKIPTKKA